MRRTRSTLWALALLLAALLAVAAFRGCSLPDGRPIAGVLEQAPLPLPPVGPGAVFDDLQRQARGATEQAREDGSLRGGDATARVAETVPAADNSRRFMFDCGNGVIFAVRTSPGEATVFSPPALGAEVLRLPQREAASGEWYASDEAAFRSRGGLATFEIGDRTYADCTSSPGAATTAEALRRGATFRALGNEPSWALEILRERIELATEHGARRIDFPYREPTVAGARTTYRTFAGTQELLVTIDRMPCNDTMSGELFDATVTVLFESATLYGCGRAQ